MPNYVGMYLHIYYLLYYSYSYILLLIAYIHLYAQYLPVFDSATNDPAGQDRTGQDRTGQAGGFFLLAHPTHPTPHLSFSPYIHTYPTYIHTMSSLRYSTHPPTLGGPSAASSPQKKGKRIREMGMEMEMEMERYRCGGAWVEWIHTYMFRTYLPPPPVPMSSSSS